MTVRVLKLVFLLSFPILLNGQNHDNVILDYSTLCQVNNGRKIVTKSYLIQINNENGNWIADIQLPFQKGNKIKSIDGEIREISGNVVRKLKKSDLTETSHISDISLYDDNLVKKFNLKHNQYPYLISYQYTVEQDEFLWIESWSPVLYRNTPTLKAKLSVQVPQEFPIKINQRHITEFSVDSINGTTTYQWRAEYLNAINDEILAPQIRELQPTVKIVPVDFRYGVIGSHDTWKTYGNWQVKLGEHLTTLPIHEQGRIHHLIKGVDDPKEVVKILYNYMQDNTRYINVSIDIGGMKPYPAEYVATNKYGDCKALTNYMKALLEVAGVSSYFVDVYADENPVAIVEDFPSQQFNHVILMVPLEKDTIWLENTSNTGSAGYVSTFIQNRKGLLINDNSQLINIPALGLDDVLESKNISYTIDGEKNCRAEINIVARGPNYELYTAISEFSRNEQKQILQNYLPFKNFELADWRILKPERNLAEASIKTSMMLKNFIAGYDEDLILRPQPLSIPDFETPQLRQQPVRVNYPIYSIDTITFNYPNNMTFKKHSEKQNVDSSFGSYSIEVENHGDHVKMIRKFILNSGDYSLSEYPEFYNFIQIVRTAESKNFINLLMANN